METGSYMGRRDWDKRGFGADSWRIAQPRRLARFAGLRWFIVDGRRKISFMHDLHVAAWSVLPFACLLLAIALLPMLAEKWWHNNRRKAIVSLGLAVPVIAYLGWLEWFDGQPALAKLGHAVLEYVEFIVLLAALYTVAGGIAVQVISSAMT